MEPTRIVAIYRWLAAATIFSSVVWQVTDRLANNLFRPAEYFAYFSIQGTLIASVMLAYTGWLAWTGTAEKRQVTIARVSATTYALVIALVYNALLRGLPGDIRDAGYNWPVVPNEIMHVWAAVLILLDWLIVAGTSQVRLRAAFWVAAFPLAWLAFSVTRGIVDGWWAYWFLNPNDEGGLSGMFTYIGGITVLMISLGFLLLGARKLIAKLTV
ncbi:MAG: Pr6Pr family membrane protein [Rhodoluna sp.]|nr:Pr6Pr family membrane protein [Rhodoluna sp.]